MNRLKVLLFWGSVCFAPYVLFSQTGGGTGKLFRWDSYKSYKANDSVAFQRTLYDYPLPTQRVETNYQFEEGLWVEQTRLSLTYDALGRTIENIFERYDPGAQYFFPQVRTQTFPRGNSLTETDSVFTYNWSADQSSWERFIAEKRRFNAQNQLVEIETSISFSGQSFKSRNLNYYDAQGNLVRIENYSFVNGQFLPISFTRQVFENGLLRNSTSYAVVPPADSVPLNRTLYTYNANNLISSVEISNWDLVSKAWVKASSATYTYTATKQLQSQINTVIANGMSQTTRNDYFYKANGEIIQEQNYVGLGEPPEWILDSKKFYFYDVASSVKEPKVSTRALQISPNPGVDEIRLDLPSGAYFQVYNTAGQIQLSGEMNGQNRLNISQWPKGMYLIVAQDRQIRWVGKVVKE